MRFVTSLLAWIAGALLVWVAGGSVVATVGSAAQSDPVVVAMTLLDLESDGVLVRGRTTISVVNQSGTPLRALTLRLERPSPGSLTPDTVDIGDLEIDGTGVARAEVLLDQALLATTDAWVARLTYVDSAGETVEAEVSVSRETAGGR